MKEVTVKELKEMLDNGQDFQLVDVREQNENDFTNIEGDLVPMSSLRDHIDKFSKDKQVIVYCRSGKRSADVIRFLEANHSYDNLSNLKGGILAWSDEIDPSIPKY